MVEIHLGDEGRRTGGEGMGGKGRGGEGRGGDKGKEGGRKVKDKDE